MADGESPELTKLYDEIMKGGYHTINVGGVMITGNVEKLKKLIQKIEAQEDEDS